MKRRSSDFSWTNLGLTELLGSLVGSRVRGDVGVVGII